MTTLTERLKSFPRRPAQPARKAEVRPHRWRFWLAFGFAWAAIYGLALVSTTHVAHSLSHTLYAGDGT